MVELDLIRYGPLGVVWDFVSDFDSCQFVMPLQYIRILGRIPDRILI